ncbi:hypothetical protein QP919_05200 [Corynebacterium propinquum]|uniref:Secreted protein n=1 Tax=Corynebacterium propinquum TaxID=43769 RepID=A0AAP4F7R4_9CORY|nr:hypothetical protein [Corynebacterium propinquum]MDK4303059.1 hypothetical protein [Corynebacterium propinquum]MDK4325824.1 hypothetical protein [Corynebacterium propinquum]MDK8722792.1 hypothetical protein [Corynebacterium propinquum]UQV59843.1 hypothetical protein L9H28_08630 [Corynebacterium propinquum]
MKKLIRIAAGIIGMFAFGATASTAQAEQLSSEHIYQPGDQVPTYVDPDGFLPDTSAPGSGFRSAATCVNVSDNDGKVTVSNDCDIDQRVKILVAFGSDSSCLTLPPGASHTHDINDFVPGPFVNARFDGVENC